MRYKLVVIFICLVQAVNGQDLAFARKTVTTLSSKDFWGRGYTKEGLKKAASYIRNEFRSYGLKPLDNNSYFQAFTFPVNTFPGDMKLSVDGVRLQPGKDFIVSPESRGIKVNTRLVQTDSSHFRNDKHSLRISFENKLTWSVSQTEADFTSIKIMQGALKASPRQIKVDIDNQYNSSFKANNIVGIVRGTANPDSLIVITAHYDHLGGMGNETFFPGANDNASGVALLLGLAKYYAANPPTFSIVFICFAGEEAGLVGSKHFVENPLITLKDIRFLINTDLAGTGDEGITVVNGTIFKKEFSLLTEINSAQGLLSKVNSRGKAANSDHFWFTQKGVPSFFIYTMGGIKAYHDIYDRAETLPLTEYENLFRLLLEFNKALMH